MSNLSTPKEMIASLLVDAGKNILSKNYEHSVAQSLYAIAILLLNEENRRVP